MGTCLETAVDDPDVEHASRASTVGGTVVASAVVSAVVAVAESAQAEPGMGGSMTQVEGKYQ